MPAYFDAELVTIPISLVHGMLTGIRNNRENEEIFLFDAGIPLNRLSDINSRITAAQYIGLYRSLIERRDDEMLGFISRPLRQGSFSLITQTALSTNHLESAIEQISKTFRIIQDDVTISKESEKNQTRIALHFNPSMKPRPLFLDEMLIRILWRLLAWLAGGKLPVIRFDFAFNQPYHIDSYQRIFPAPCTFNAEHSAFWLDNSKLSTRIKRDHSALKEFMTAIHQNIILPVRENNILSMKIRQHLYETGSTWPELNEIASVLKLPVSTLQRKLYLEGTSFHAIKDELRRDMAIHKLNTTTISLSDLSQQLGFSDNATFQRAFKRWTGQAPGTYRKHQPDQQ